MDAIVRAALKQQKLQDLPVPPKGSSVTLSITVNNTPEEPARRVDELISRVQDKKDEYVKSTNAITTTTTTTAAMTPDNASDQPQVSEEEDAAVVVAPLQQQQQLAEEPKKKKKFGGKFKMLAKVVTAPAKITAKAVGIKPSSSTEKARRASEAVARRASQEATVEIVENVDAAATTPATIITTPAASPAPAPVVEEKKKSKGWKAFKNNLNVVKALKTVAVVPRKEKPAPEPEAPPTPPAAVEQNVAEVSSPPTAAEEPVVAPAVEEIRLEEEAPPAAPAPAPAVVEEPTPAPIVEEEVVQVEETKEEPAVVPVEEEIKEEIKEEVIEEVKEEFVFPEPIPIMEEEEVVAPTIEEPVVVEEPAAPIAEQVEEPVSPSSEEALDADDELSDEERATRLESLLNRRESAENRISELRSELRSCHEEFERLQVEGDILEQMRQELLAIQEEGRRVVLQDGEAVWQDKETATTLKRKRDDDSQTPPPLNSKTFDRHSELEGFWEVNRMTMEADIERQVRWRVEYTKLVLRDEEAARRLKTDEDARIIANALQELERAETMEREQMAALEINIEEPTPRDATFPFNVPTEINAEDVEQVLREQDAESAGKSLLGLPQRSERGSIHLVEEALRKEQEEARAIVEAEEDSDSSFTTGLRKRHTKVLEKQHKQAVEHENRRAAYYQFKRSKDRALTKMVEQRQAERQARQASIPEPNRETKPRAVKKLEERQKTIELDDAEHDRLLQLAWEQEWQRQRQIAKEKEQERLLQLAWEQELHRHQKAQKLQEEEERLRLRRAERYYTNTHNTTAKQTSVSTPSSPVRKTARPVALQQHSRSMSASAIHPPPSHHHNYQPESAFVIGELQLLMLTRFRQDFLRDSGYTSDSSA